jgi:3-hydroxyisobutyrate dehydrogenase-like beta-hydroxyacid dehydrogenase
VGRVAVLGTGIMGGPMARNLLQSGHEVTVWNRTVQKTEALKEEGGASSSSTAQSSSATPTRT